jgi:pimeloyl-ACP methyl ester carboxylesterase
MTDTTPALSGTRYATSADGTRIAYDTIGAGPLVVVVGGALNWREFGNVRSLGTALAPLFTVVNYDRRGRGESGDTEPYAAEREYEDLRAVIDANGGDAYVVGFSSGGALALQAAAHGVPMRKVVSYEAPYIGVNGDRDYLADLRGRLDRGDREGAVGYFMVDMVGGPRFMPLMFKLMPKVRRQLEGVAHTLPYDATVMGTFEAPRDVLSRVAVPALVLGGGKAKPNMRRAVADAAAAIPGSVTKTLPGQTHMVSDAAIVPELVAFFR